MAGPGGPADVSASSARWDDALDSANRVLNRLRVGSSADAAGARRLTGVNERDARGNTALMLASAEADAAELEALIGHGALVNLCNDVGSTALMIAASNDLAGNCQVVLARSSVGMK